MQSLQLSENGAPNVRRADETGGLVVTSPSVTMASTAWGVCTEHPSGYWNFSTWTTR